MTKLVTVMSTMQVKSGSEAEVANALAALAVASRAEPGCLTFRVFQSAETPTEFRAFEQFADDAAFKSHQATEHVSAFRTRRDPHRTKPVELTVWTEIQVDNLV